MKSDSLFYKLFSVYPASFFQLANLPEVDGTSYRFESVEVKETAFRMDGLFLPHEGDRDKPVIICEVQMQKDDDIYYRIFAELHIYLHRKKPPHPWRVVLFFLKRSLEPDNILHHHHLLNSPAVERIYLDEILVSEQPLGVTLMQLIVGSESSTPERARNAYSRAQTEIRDDSLRREIIDLIDTMLVYKFPRLSREDIQAMYALSDLKQTRVYREALEEGREEGREEGLAVGEARGLLQGKLESVPLLLKQGMSVEAIASALNLSVEQVQQAAESRTD